MFESAPPEKKAPKQPKVDCIGFFLKSCYVAHEEQRFLPQNSKIAVILAYGEHLKSICFRDTSNAEKDLSHDQCTDLLKYERPKAK